VILPEGNKDNSSYIRHLYSMIPNNHILIQGWMLPSRDIRYLVCPMRSWMVVSIWYIFSLQTQGCCSNNHIVKDEALRNLMMSWYYAGYYTGLYDGQRVQNPAQPWVCCRSLDKDLSPQEMSWEHYKPNAMIVTVLITLWYRCSWRSGKIGIGTSW